MKPLRFKIHNNLLICLFLVITTLAVYWQVKDHEFIDYDDPLYVSDNPYVQEGLSLKGFIWAFTSGYAKNWHPLTWLSHMSDVQLFGLDAGKHHLINLLFHIANTLLLFLVFNKMTGNFWQSGFVAALFALHPLHVESVAQIAERKDVLSAFFWMLTLWRYLLYVEAPSKSKYIAVIFCFIAGLLAKPMVVTLPFVLLLLDYYPLNRMWKQKIEAGSSLRLEPTKIEDDSSIRLKSRISEFNILILWEKIPFFILIIISSTITFLVQKSGGAVRSLETYPIDVRIANALVSYVNYIKKMIIPENLAFFYPHPKIIEWEETLIAFFLLISISLLTLKSAKRHPYFIVGWLWYLGTLIPVIGLVQVGYQAMADRYTYIPLIGIFIMIAWGFPSLLARWRYKHLLFATVGVIMIPLLMAMSYIQVGYWKNSITLFGHALGVTEKNHIAHNNIGVVLAREGKTTQAMNHYTQALLIDPNYAAAYKNMGNLFLNQNNDGKAMEYYNESLRLNPDDAEVHSNMGVIFANQGRLEDAMTHFQTAVKVNPDYAIANYNLAKLLKLQGHLKEAIPYLQTALFNKPDYAEAHHNIASIFSELGRTPEAITHFQKALQLNPNDAETLGQLGIAFLQQGNPKDALTYLEKALAITPDDSQLHNNLGIALFQNGRVQDSIAHFRKALEIEPNNTEARNNLEKILEMGN